MPASPSVTITFPNKAALAAANAAASLYTEDQLPGIAMGQSSLGNAVCCNLATGPGYPVSIVLPDDWAIAIQQAMGPICPDDIPGHEPDALRAAYEAVCGRDMPVGYRIPGTNRTV